MPTIEIRRVGTSDESLLRRNFANLLNEKFGAKKPVTLADRIKAKGIDEKHQVRLARRRDRYALDPRHGDRPKTFAKDSTPGHSVFCHHKYTTFDADRDLSTIKKPADTADYVSAWCRLNHLTV